MAFDYEARPEVGPKNLPRFVSVAMMSITFDIMHASSLTTLSRSLASNIIMDGIMRASTAFNMKPSSQVFSDIATAMSNQKNPPFPIQFSPGDMVKSWEKWLSFWASAQYMAAGIGLVVNSCAKINDIVGEITKSSELKLFGSRYAPWDDRFVTSEERKNSLVVFGWYGVSDDVYLGAVFIPTSGEPIYIEDIIETKLAVLPEVMADAHTFMDVRELHNALHDFNMASALAQSSGALNVSLDGFPNKEISALWDGVPLSFLGVKPHDDGSLEVSFGENAVNLSDDDIAGRLGFTR